MKRLRIKRTGFDIVDESLPEIAEEAEVVAEDLWDNRDFSTGAGWRWEDWSESAVEIWDRGTWRYCGRVAVRWPSERWAHASVTRGWLVCAIDVLGESMGTANWEPDAWVVRTVDWFSPGSFAMLVFRLLRESNTLGWVAGINEFGFGGVVASIKPSTGSPRCFWDPTFTVFASVWLAWLATKNVLNHNRQTFYVAQEWAKRKTNRHHHNCKRIFINSFIRCTVTGVGRGTQGEHSPSNTLMLIVWVLLMADRLFQNWSTSS